MPQDLIERLHDAFTTQPDCVHCHRARAMIFDGNSYPKPYREWRLIGDGNDAPSHMIFPDRRGWRVVPTRRLIRHLTEDFSREIPTADDVGQDALLNE